MLTKRVYRTSGEAARVTPGVWTGREPRLGWAESVPGRSGQSRLRRGGGGDA